MQCNQRQRSIREQRCITSTTHLTSRRCQDNFLPLRETSLAFYRACTGRGCCPPECNTYRTIHSTGNVTNVAHTNNRIQRSLRVTPQHRYTTQHCTPFNYTTPLHHTTLHTIQLYNTSTPHLHCITVPGQDGSVLQIVLHHVGPGATLLHARHRVPVARQVRQRQQRRPLAQLR